jgi:molecular chaperone Hsp33
VPLLVAEVGDGGALRGYARLAKGAANTMAREHRVAPADLLGAGNLVMTLERSGDQPAYQGVVTLEGKTLAECAENFFGVSEQTDTRIALVVGEVLGGAAPLWRAGGILMQRVASDAARGDTSEDWSRASMLFATVTDAELVDPDLPADRLLYRLFHEEGVRMGDSAPLRDLCTCDEERLTKVMQQFPAHELRELVEPDGQLHARCQFCSRKYLIAPERVVTS